MAGEPLGFRFAGMALTESSGSDREAAASLVERGLRGSPGAPVVLFGLLEGETARELDDLWEGVPFCRVRPLPPGGETAVSRPESGNLRERMIWRGGSPAPESAAGGILATIMQHADPLEPLERVARGLEEAFADPGIRAVTGAMGLSTVIALRPRRPNERVERADGPSPSGREATGGETADGATARGSEAGGGQDLAERLWAVLAAPLTAVPSDPPDESFDWIHELMPFQKDGIRALIEMNRLLLADDMGLGKTVQAVAAIRILRARRAVRSCLVLAPAGVLDQWRREIAAWAPELTAIIVRGSRRDREWQWTAGKDLFLVSYDVWRSDQAFAASHCAGGCPWDLAVLDEAQKIKNRNDTSEAAKKIPRVRSWALSGTPIENHEEELASILEFVDHEDGSARKRYRPGVNLQQRHRELQLRRRKSEVLRDLPPKLETRLRVDLHPDQRDSYDRAEREGIVHLRSLGRDAPIRHVLELITRLKQICNRDPRTGASSKLDDIADRLRTLTAQGHKALVFSQFTSDTAGVAAAAHHLREFCPLTLTGDVPVERREALIHRFRTDKAHQALIISLRAGGLGLNLQEASYVFHLDRWWNPAVERQAEDRTHRMGQTVKVNVIKYTCEKTIEERIDKILREKQTLFDRLVDDVSLDLSTRLSRDELLRLFDLG